MKTPELDFKERLVVKRGYKGPEVKRIQEWLTLNRIAVACDGDFGPATEAAIKAFRKEHNRSGPATVDKELFTTLSLSMIMALDHVPTAATTIGAHMVATARLHLEQEAREVGGDNRGPWVRYYCNGKDGPMWYWCAGFVSRIAEQSSRALKVPMPFTASLSCDDLAREAKKKGKLAKAGDPRIKPGALFLVRKSSDDWIHTGIVTKIGTDYCHTQEGNSNDEGSRNGFEVCARVRALHNLDFVVI